MKQHFFKNRAFRFVICLAFLFAAFVIHSCKKDMANQQQNTITDPAVNTAKSWYQSTYPVAASTGSLVIQSTNNTPGTFDFSQHITPDWSHASVYTRLGANVTELPIDVSAKFSAALQNITLNKIIYKKEYSKSSFLLLNDGTGYSAYIMVIVADSSYLKNNLSKLSHNSYSKRDTDFSGMALYFTPKGSFVSGWLYKNGVLMPAENSNATPATTKQVQSTGNTKLAPQYIEPVCYDYTLIFYSNGVATASEYLFTDCEGGDENGGGSGSSGGGSSSGSSGSGGGVGGSGSGNGSSSAPSSSQYPPCPGTQAPNATGKLVINNVPAAPPSGSGFPPPTSGPQCTTPTNTVVPAVNTITNNVTNPCLAALINQLINDQALQTNVTSILRNTFEVSDQVNLTFAQGDLTNTDVGTGAAGTDGPQKDNFVITFNTPIIANASKEYLMETTIHEIFHAYLYANPLVKGTFTQHQYMIQNYINTEVQALQLVFPNLSIHDAECLVLGGYGDLDTATLNATIATYNLSLNDVVTTNNNYKTGTVGTKC